MLRSAERSSGMEPSSLCRSFQDCIIATRGYNFREGQLVATLGIDADGNKHPLGLMEGATENATVNLQASHIGQQHHPIRRLSPTR